MSLVQRLGDGASAGAERLSLGNAGWKTNGDPRSLPLLSRDLSFLHEHRDTENGIEGRRCGPDSLAPPERCHVGGAHLGAKPTIAPAQPAAGPLKGSNVCADARTIRLICGSVVLSQLSYLSPEPRVSRPQPCASNTRPESAPNGRGAGIRSRRLRVTFRRFS